MKRNKIAIIVLMLVMAFLVAACSSTAAEEQAVETPAAMEEVPDDASGDDSDETMMDDDSDEAMDDEDESMNDGSDEAMDDEDESMDDGSDEAMDDEDESMDDDSDEDMDDEDESMENDSEEEMMEQSTAVLSLDLTGLDNLGQEWAYEGWLIVDGGPISTGVFTVDDAGAPSETEFEVDADHLADAALFVLTIEPASDPDPAPSPVHILAGEFDDSGAILSISHPAALGTDFSDTEGSTYILGIPSSDSDGDSYSSGIWFTGLNLPELPAGWVYEGWVVGPDGPITTGRFSSGSEVDSDGTGPTAGPNPGPANPGQDFLNPAVFLTDGYVIVISVEPDPDNSAAPFTLKPLIDTEVEDAGDHGSQELSNSSNSFPTGTATRATG
jgi:hypothetical protein